MTASSSASVLITGAKLRHRTFVEHFGQSGRRLRRLRRSDYPGQRLRGGSPVAGSSLGKWDRGQRIARGNRRAIVRCGPSGKTIVDPVDGLQQPEPDSRGVAEEFVLVVVHHG